MRRTFSIAAIVAMGVSTIAMGQLSLTKPGGDYPEGTVHKDTMNGTAVVHAGHAKFGANDYIVSYVEGDRVPGYSAGDIEVAPRLFVPCRRSVEKRDPKDPKDAK